MARAPWTPTPEELADDPGGAEAADVVEVEGGSPSPGAPAFSLPHALVAGALVFGLARAGLERFDPPLALPVVLALVAALRAGLGGWGFWRDVAAGLSALGSYRARR